MRQSAFALDLLRRVLERTETRYVECDIMLLFVYSDGVLPNRLGVALTAREDGIVASTQIAGMSFVGLRGVKGLEYCNEWNERRPDACASLNKAGVLYVVQTISFDGASNDEDVLQDCLGRYLWTVKEFYTEAAKRFDRIEIETQRTKATF